MGKALIINKMETKKRFNKRAFTSVGMLAYFLSLPFSGLMNHYTGFSEMTVERHFWMTVHDVSGILFCAFAIIHIIFNWRSIKNYIHNLKGAIVNKEAITAAVIVLFVTLFIASHAFHVR